MISSVLISVVIIVLVVVSIFSIIGDSFREVSNGGSVRYDEEAFQAYADDQYAQIYSDAAYEDNLLIVVLTAEDCYEFCYIAWVGDHIEAEVSDLLGDNSTTLGQAMNSYINDTNYRYSLDSDLARVVKAMAQRIRDLGLENNYTCQEDHSASPIGLVNYTDLPLTESTVNDELAKFREITGIPCAIVVEDMEDVFGRSVSGHSLVTLALLIGIAVVIVISLLSGAKRKQNNGEENYHRRQDDYDHY